jgi:hypothetical protein
MVDWLLGLGAGNLTAGVLVGVFIILVFTGKIIPVTTVRKLLAREIQRGDDWKEAYLASEQARKLQDGQVGELLEHSRTSVRVLEAIQRINERDGHV